MSRIANIQKMIGSSEFDALIITSEVNQRYASGFNYQDGYIMIFPERAYLLTDFRYIEAAKATVAEADFEILMPENHLISMATLAEKHGAKRIALEEDLLPFGMIERLKKAFSADTEFVGGGSAFLNSLRIVKGADEIEKIKAAQSIADRAFEHILKVMTPNMTEIDVALELEFFMRREGSEGVAFETIAVSGGASALPHGVPRNVKLERGFFTMDYGARVDGYCSDMTRTVVIGKADADMKKIYNTVLEAQLASLAFAKEGVTGKAVDKVARDIIDKAGYEGRFGHGLGHGVGLFIHEAPRLSKADAADVPLVAGNVVTFEPGIYIEGKYGCRIEDMGAITTDGVDNFAHSTKELIELF